MAVELEAKQSTGKKLSKKILNIPVLLGISLVIISMAAVGYFFWQKNYGPVAVVDGLPITKEEVKERSEKFSKFYAYNKDQSSLDNIEKVSTNALVEQSIVQSEASRRGVTVSDEEVSARFGQYLKLYKDQSEMSQAIYAAYGWSIEDFKDSIRDNLLKEKLNDVVVAKRDVSFIFYRYDFDGDEGLKLAMPAIQMSQANIQNGVTLEHEADRVKANGSLDWRSPNFGINIQKGLNDKTATSRFNGAEDWEAISKLNKQGDYTDIVKSSGGYLALYRLDSINSGTFDSWQEFIDSYKGSSSYKTPLLSVDKWLFDHTSKALANGGCVSGLTLQNGMCTPKTATQNQSHYGYIYGFVTSSIGGALDGASMTAEMLVDPGLQPPVNANGITNPFTGGSYYNSDWGDGFYTLGWSPTNMGSGSKGNATGHGLIPCYWGWKVTASKAGYISSSTNIVFVNGQAYAQSFVLSPTPPPPPPTNPDPAVTLNSPSDGQRFDLNAEQAASGINIPLSATITDSDDEDVTMFVYIKKCAPLVDGNFDCASGDWNPVYADSSYHPSPWAPTGITSGLIKPGEGEHAKYVWYANGYDLTTAAEERIANSEFRTFTVFGRPGTPKVACTVAPSSGVVPFSIKVNYTVTYPGDVVDPTKILVSMGDGTTFSGTQRPPATDFRYSYNQVSNSGKYTVNISYPGATETCVWDVKAYNPGESDGGERTP